MTELLIQITDLFRVGPAKSESLSLSSFFLCFFLGLTSLPLESSSLSFSRNNRCLLLLFFLLLLLLSESEPDSLFSSDFSLELSSFPFFSDFFLDDSSFCALDFFISSISVEDE